MLKIGCHLSASKGFKAMGIEALEIDANTFQFFTRNPRGSKAKEIEYDDINGLLEIMKENHFTNILGHAPYTINPCSSEAKTRQFTLVTIIDDLVRMEYLPNNLYVIHPGSHVGQGVNTGIENIIDLLNMVLKKEQTTKVLLETMAGKGTEIGSTFEELRLILDGVKLKKKVGVCLDTCHVYDSGYDIVNNLDWVLEEFNQTIGLDKLYAIHLNDSVNTLGSRKDRHSIIGEGLIGFEAFARIINHPELRSLPFILETPNDVKGHSQEIKLLRQAFQY